MNKFINILLLLISFPTLVIAIFVGYDLPIEFLKTSGASLPFKFQIFLSLGIIYYIIIVRRSVRRWMGVAMVSKTEKFKWNVSMGEGRRKQVFLYQWLEALIMSSGGISLYYVCPDAIAPASALWVGSLDNIIFMILGQTKKLYRIGITSKAVVVADREVKVLYLSGLRKVTIHQQTVFFDYIKDLQMTFSLTCIPKEDQVDFKNTLESLVDRDRVFFSDDVKNL
jgi:hypothetical protein